ncbi:MAG: methyltransferase, partial [Rectinema sp.]
MTELSPYVNKTVEFAFMGARLRLELSHALFSSFDVDSGTRLLLKAVARDPVLAGARRVLDAGCGTGVIGLAVAKAFPDTEVTLRDRDMLAV